MFSFRLFGFHVQVQWFFWLTCIVLGGGFYARTPEDWIRVAIWTAVVFLSIMLHELGHAWMGRRYGAQPYIVLHGLGGLTALPGATFNRSQNVWVSLAGPGAGLALGIVLVATAPFLPLGGTYAHVALGFLVYVNIFWSLFNLLPVLPMDGGQVLRAILGPRRLHIALWTGAVVAVMLALIAAYARQWFIAIFMGFLAYSNWKNRTMPGGVVRG